MDSRIKRREFCQAGGAALIGIVAGPCFLRGSEVRASASAQAPSAPEVRPEGKNQLDEEGIMEKKIEHIEVKVINVKGTCGLGHKAGDIIKVTEQGIEGKICIHALYSMLPAVFAMMFEARFPWLTNPDKKTHACPDAANPVVFEIARIREA
ncbi:MAG: TIGR04076 family protein [Clostridiales bacterium]|nr:TIGR04076 family protein [Clostridiales bacterium]